MEIQYDLEGSVTPLYLDYLAKYGPVTFEDFAKAMDVTVSGLKTNLGSIERSANGEYGSGKPSTGPESWSTVFSIARNGEAELLEIDKEYYAEYKRRRNEPNYDLQGSVTPVYLDYLAENGPVTLESFAAAMEVSVKGLKSNLGSIERDGNWEYGCETRSAGSESWSTVFKLSCSDGIEFIEVVRTFYEGYVSGRDL